MAGRDDADVSRDLVLALLAFQRGLVDQAQLRAALETWAGSTDRSMAEVLVGRGVLDPHGRALLEDLVARHLANPGPEPFVAAAGPAQGEGVAPLDPSEPSATVAHREPEVSPEDRDDPDRTTGVGAGENTSVAPASSERFRIVRPYARGGLGEVFLAVDPELDRQVALKELRGYHAHDPVSQSRFLLEAKVTGRLEHPGIVPVYGLGRHADGRPYYAMRFIEGETLKQAIERFHHAEQTSRPTVEREIAFRRLLRSLIDACHAVAYAHSRGVLHRDVKPENIMLGRFGETLVVDWGIAKPLPEAGGEPAVGSAPGGDLTEDSSLTRPGSAIGTPQYMSPEQAAGDLDKVGPASDVYSLGATLYCLLVGHGPFPAGSVADVLERARRGIFPGPRRLRRSVDPALEAICLKAMSLKPEDRHATPMALAEEIEAWLADVRYRSEQEQALVDVQRTLARLCIERAHNLFDRQRHDEGMLWLTRALENIPAEFLDFARSIRASLAGWHAGEKLMERSLAHREAVHAVAFSPDGRRLATACGDRTARLWDVAQGLPLVAPMNHQGAVRSIAFSPDGRLIATTSDDRTLRRWDALTGEPVGSPIRHEDPIRAVRFSPDGSKIATASRSSRPCLWDAATGRPIGGDEPGEPEARVLAIGFNADGTLLAVAGDDGTVWLRETATGRRLGRALRHEAAVPALAFSPDGRTLVCGCGDGRARLWALDQEAPLAEFAHRAEAGFVAFSPAGRSVVTACPDGSARIWDAGTGKPIGEPLTHRAPVDCLAFHPDGTMVATGSQDGTARLWDADTGLPIGPPLGHRGAVQALAFSPDARRLATAGADGMARSWRVPAPIPGDCERIACWVRILTELDFDEGDAIRPIDQLALWELRRRLQELGGAPVK
ncbi:MAG TPA: serine/threonine-protein kinase [Isosphaeraceae bacterium]|nr:serine/threonine-protein kinase [Isosphaeraceae bacterium]